MNKKTSEVLLSTLISKKKKFYSSIGMVYSPILRKEVSFNGQGFRHLYIEGTGHPRGDADARMRLNLLDNAPNLVKTSKMIANYRLVPPSVNTDSKQIIYYELFGRIGTSQAKAVVIIRQVGNGNYHFYGIRYAGKKNRPR